jgi:hypothetical protein
MTTDLLIQAPRRRGRPPKNANATVSTPKPTQRKTTKRTVLKASKATLPAPSPKGLNGLLKETQASLKQLDALIAAAEAQVKQLPLLKQQRQHCLMLALSLDALSKNTKLIPPQPEQLPLLVSPSLASWVSSPEPELAPVQPPARLASLTQLAKTEQPITDAKRRGRPASANTLNKASQTIPQKRGRKAPDINSIPLPDGVFIPDVALEQAKAFIKQPGTLNHNIFKAIVYSGGRATSEQVRNYLINNDIRLPKTNQHFDEVPLAKLSTKLTYLAKQGMIDQYNGIYTSKLGWQTDAYSPSV